MIFCWTFVYRLNCFLNFLKRLKISAHTNRYKIILKHWISSDDKKILVFFRHECEIFLSRLFILVPYVFMILFSNVSKNINKVQSITWRPICSKKNTTKFFQDRRPIFELNLFLRTAQSRIFEEKNCNRPVWFSSMAFIPSLMRSQFNSQNDWICTSSWSN